MPPESYEFVLSVVDFENRENTESWFFGRIAVLAND